MVTIVLLNVDLMCATPVGMFFLTLRAPVRRVGFAISQALMEHWTNKNETIWGQTPEVSADLTYERLSSYQPPCDDRRDGFGHWCESVDRARASPDGDGVLGRIQFPSSA